MNPVVRHVALTVLLAAVAGALGAYAGVRLTLARSHADPGLHQLLHRELKLSPQQAKRIDGLEQSFDARRRTLEAEMRGANAELAEAIATRHAYTPDVQRAIDRFHAADGALQKATIVHVLAMRAVLTPDQTGRFDRTISEALTTGQP